MWICPVKGRLVCMTANWGEPGEDRELLLLRDQGKKGPDR
jgi:hypothetical protein